MTDYKEKYLKYKAKYIALRGSGDFTEKDIEEFVEKLISNKDLIAQCKDNKKNFKDLFINPTKCDLFFVNMLGKVTFTKMLFENSPTKEKINPSDINSITELLENNSQIQQQNTKLKIKYTQIVNEMINKLCTIETLKTKIANIPQKDRQKIANTIDIDINKDKEINESLTIIKDILQTYYNINKTSITQNQKDISKQIIKLLKFLNVYNKNLHNINNKYTDTINKKILSKLENLIEEYKKISNQIGGTFDKKIIDFGNKLSACIFSFIFGNVLKCK